MPFAGQHVIFLFDTVDRPRLFEQLALLHQLQGFCLPDPDDSPRKWKSYAAEGRYTWGRAHRVTVVLPWYRPCQMERTCRWEAPQGNWTNTAPRPSKESVTFTAFQGPLLHKLCIFIMYIFINTYVQFTNIYIYIYRVYLFM